MPIIRVEKRDIRSYYTFGLILYLYEYSIDSPCSQIVVYRCFVMYEQHSIPGIFALLDDPEKLIAGGGGSTTRHQFP